MRATWATLQTDIQNLDKLRYLYENEPRKFPNVNKRELQVRIKNIDDFKEYVNGELTRGYRALESA